jgi:hypothetical protein
MTRIAKPIGARRNPVQRGIHFTQQGLKISLIRRRAYNRFETLLSLFQLTVQKTHFSRCH